MAILLADARDVNNVIMSAIRPSCHADAGLFSMRIKQFNRNISANASIRFLAVGRPLNLPMPGISMARAENSEMRGIQRMQMRIKTCHISY